MDKIDQRILRELQSNARIANVELAKRVGLSATPCFERVRKLERQGVISGYHARVNYAAVGFSARAFILLKLEFKTQDALEELRAAVAAMPEIEECHFVVGKNDCVVKVACQNNKELQTLYTRRLLCLPCVRDAESLFIIDPIKDGGGRAVQQVGPDI